MFATDWALKRVLKFLLKKSIGRFLHSEPDLEQLDVQLSSGTFELRNVLLNCQVVNEQLVSTCTWAPQSRHNPSSPLSAHACMLYIVQILSCRLVHL